MVLAWSPVVLVVFLLTAWWDGRRRIVGRCFRLLSPGALRLNPLWSVRFHGTLPEDRDRAHVVVCNHESLADPVFLGSLPWDAKWVAKDAVFRLPVFGQMMRMAGDVRVRRGDPESRAEAYEELKSWILRGASVMVFPEGTRSPDGELLPFRNGAFRLALETGTPVLPLAVVGSRRALRKGSLVFGRATADVAVLEPESVEGRGTEDVEDLRDTVRDRIARARRRLRDRTRRGTGHDVPGGSDGASVKA
jgi:1-acyl-sn-glycerol-3-phosphate acyltransferase